MTDEKFTTGAINGLWLSALLWLAIFVLLSFFARALGAEESPRLGEKPVVNREQVEPYVCVPSEMAGVDCLVGDRYEVRARRDIGRDWEVLPFAGSAQDDTAWPTFHRIVGLIRVLEPGDGSAWVFAALATDQGISIAVTDTWYGRRVTYLHRRGSPMPTITDTQAFPGAEVEVP